MLASAELMAFVATADAERARAFYEGVLGLPVVSEEPVALVFDANGTTLRMAKVERVATAPYTVLGWRVDDVGATVKALAARGVAFERYDGFEQDADGAWHVPGGGLVAWFKDPDGNLLSISGSG
jgi:catechol 2,3-dioxygenase-like lactoylglutathione lyase family enzyme